MTSKAKPRSIFARKQKPRNQPSSTNVAERGSREKEDKSGHLDVMDQIQDNLPPLPKASAMMVLSPVKVQKPPSGGDRSREMMKKKDKQEGTFQETEGDDFNVRKDADVLTGWLNRVLEVGVDGLVKEYKEVANEAPIEKAIGSKENPTKNRYFNIPCCEATRVKIPTRPNLYIHANFISSHNNRTRFIATQSPLNSTVEDFWRMVCAHGSEFIVMLCGLVEKGKSKSAEYFPKQINEVLMVPTFCTVTKEGQTEPEANITISTFRVNRLEDGVVSCVRHIHWHNWPDHGVPDAMITPFKVFSVFRKSRKPVVVHCAAGVGRTGTLILLGLLMEHIKTPGFTGVQSLLKGLREERWKAVQTDLQYLYIHRCMMEYLVIKKHVPSSMAQMIKFRDEYTQYMGKNNAQG